MKTQISKLKLAVLSIGLLSLASCTNNMTISSALSNSSFLNHSIEMVQKNVGKRILSSASENLLQQKGSLPVAALPIFFGTIEATLVSGK